MEMKISFSPSVHITNNSLVFHPNTDWILVVSTILVVELSIKCENFDPEDYEIDTKHEPLESLAIYFIWLSYFLGCQHRM